ncbi:hypothetical protein L2E82_13793 [Cichorium intybus]|uniref:Uncharacterized protein n=1 Tax=Cichorium intybus TaxID=13427 RepID=A0ACB9EZE2_CICIN|nr:hypothetical protein L2E82_13793 [Cichorium intybus]
MDRRSVARRTGDTVWDPTHRDTVLLLGIWPQEPNCVMSYFDVMAYRVYSVASDSFRTIYFHPSDIGLVSYAIMACEDCGYQLP